MSEQPNINDAGQRASFEEGDCTWHALSSENEEFIHRDEEFGEAHAELPVTSGSEEIAAQPTQKAKKKARIQSPKEMRSATQGVRRLPSMKERHDLQGYRNSRREGRTAEERVRNIRKRKRKSASRSAPMKAEHQSWWTTVSRILTFWAFNPCLKLCGLKDKDMQQAWREKIALVMIIIILCGAVGFLTFGFNVTICGNQIRMKAKEISQNQTIILGRIYDLSNFRHPTPFPGVPDDGNLLEDPTKAGGKDLTLLFQNVNYNCKGFLIPTKTDDNSGNVINYFPCKSIDPYWPYMNRTDDPSKSGCHTSVASRQAVSTLKYIADVYYDWSDLQQSGTSLTVFNGNVLDLSRLKWLVPNIPMPALLQEFIGPTNHYIGYDATYWLSMTPERLQMGKCMQDILKVGVLDARSAGCIISDIVLYVSLIVILGVVLTRFFLAVIFGWFISGRLGSIREETPQERKKREEDLMIWENDGELHYPQSKSVASLGPTTASTPFDSSLALNNMGGSQTSLKGSGTPGRRGFLPRTSRFSSRANDDGTSMFGESIYGNNSRMFTGSVTSLHSMTNRGSNPPISMRSRSRDNFRGQWEDQMAELGSPHAYPWDFQGPYPPNGLPRMDSQMMLPENLPVPSGNLPESMSASNLAGQHMYNFNFNLLYSFMLVTCYSEGEEGLRTTLDSLANMEYPTTHKMLLVICDGLITGSGNSLSTPDIVLSMMDAFAVPKDEVVPCSYVAIADGSKRHNMAKVYAGYYKYADDSKIPLEKQQHVPMIAIVKCGTPAEATEKKPGNRGKRDSQVILMSLMRNIYYGERMCELDFEFCKSIYRLTGLHPGRFEVVLMVDADTKVFPDSLARMVACMSRDHLIMGLCGETRIANKSDSWVTMMQVFEYYISHHSAKAFESIFGGVTCLPGCFCMYRIIAPKANRFVPVLCSSDIVERYSENVVDTLHKKNLLLLGEDRYLSTLMLQHFPRRKAMFIPGAVCKTVVPDKFSILLSQRRRWINSTVHNLLELVLIRDLCGTFCFSMQFMVFMELVGTVVLPAAISFTLYLIVISFFVSPVPIIPLMLLAVILGLPAILIGLTTRKMVYIGWMVIYLLSLPIWNFILPVYAYWHFDDFSWGQTRVVEGEKKGHDHSKKDGEFDSSQIILRRFEEWMQHERRLQWEKELDRQRQWWKSRQLTQLQEVPKEIIPPHIDRLSTSQSSHIE